MGFYTYIVNPQAAPLLWMEPGINHPAQAISYRLHGDTIDYQSCSKLSTLITSQSKYPITLLYSVSEPQAIRGRYRHQSFGSRPGGIVLISARQLRSRADLIGINGYATQGSHLVNSRHRGHYIHPLAPLVLRINHTVHKLPSDWHFREHKDLAPTS